MTSILQARKGVHNKLEAQSTLCLGEQFVPTFTPAPDIEIRATLITGRYPSCFCRLMGVQSSIIMCAPHFFSVSPVRGHQVGFSVLSSSDGMQLYFRANDVISLTWMPREVVPSYLTDDFDDLLMTIELYQQIPFTFKGRADWVLLSGSRVGGVPNTGTAQYTIPAGLMLQGCGSGNQLLCPVVFRLSATVLTPAGRNVELAIWSAVGYLQSDDATASMLGELCDNWFTPLPPVMTSANEIPDSILNDLLECPSTQAQATADSRFRMETMQSALSDHNSGYRQAATKFYYPAASVCFLEIIMEGRLVVIAIEEELLGRWGGSI